MALGGTSGTGWKVATFAAHCQNFRSRASFPQKQIQKLSFQPVPLMPPSAKTSVGQVFCGNKFRNFPSNQCHWCCPVPKLPQCDYSRETISETFFPTSATFAAHCQNFHSRASLPRKKIQKLSFQPVPLVPPSAKTSAAGQVFRGNKFRNFPENQCHWCRPVPKLPQCEYSRETNSEIFLPTSATSAAQYQLFPRVIIPGKQFQKLSSTTSATGAAQCQNFRRASFPQKQIQKFSFQPVPLVPPSAKTSAG